MKKVSIVILTFNNCKETTIPCIDSVLKHTSRERVEIIAVDNNSHDETKECLLAYEKANEKYFKAIINTINYGYAKGNNIGINASSGDIVILLNNDTVVTPNWLEALLDKFEQHEKIGLVGAVSNSVGNEQQVFNPSLDITNFHSFAEEYVSKRKGNYFFTENLGFFCVAISRDVLNKIGLLDENFGVGMFEDTDYCVRALNSDYKLAVAEDCFVFHSGSFSFKKLGTEKFQELFLKNYKYFTSKHGNLWGISQITWNFWNKFSQDIDHLNTYFEKSGNPPPPALEDINFRKNSLTALFSMLMRLEKITENINYPEILNPKP
jgi:GT2 family glycosyltransferase